MTQKLTEAQVELAELELGPAMRALNDKQRQFVLNYVIAAGNTTQAAQLSGYGTTKDSSYQTGHRLLQDAKIKAAIKEDAERRLNNGAGIAAAGLMKIGLESTDEKNRIKALQTVLALAGINPIARHEHIHVHQTATAIEAEIRKMAGVLGMDADRLLGYDGDITEAIFEPVTDLPLPAPEEPEEWETAQVEAQPEEDW